MRRDYFTLRVRDFEWIEQGGSPARPTVVIDFEGPASLLRNRISGDDRDPIERMDIDVTFRFQTSIDTAEGRGVVSVTDRVTGEYILELNAQAEQIFSFIRAAREYGDHSGTDDRYGIEIRIGGDAIITYDKRTFLVYTQDGNLLREQSLIPSGVEL